MFCLLDNPYNFISEKYATMCECWNQMDTVERAVFTGINTAAAT